jgi:hypothetical protein
MEEAMSKLLCAPAVATSLFQPAANCPDSNIPLELFVSEQLLSQRFVASQSDRRGG